MRVYEASKGGEAIATSEAVAEGKVEVTITKRFTKSNRWHSVRKCTK